VAATDEGTPEVDALVEQLRARVQERRQAGAYPAGLEQDLEAHFRRIAAHRVVPNVDAVRQAMERLDVKMGFGLDRIRFDSNLPGGDRLHRAMGRVQARQTAGVLQQVQEFADGVRDVLTAMVASLEDPNGHVHADLVGQIDAVLERVTSYERGPADSAAAVGDLRRRVEELEAAEQRRRFRPWFRNDRFEEEFRGSRREILERYRDLAALFAGCAPVLDIGCGRGEFLELLAEQGMAASGVEVDPELVEEANRRGLQVELTDGLAALAAVPDGSLGGIALMQVVEHLTAQDVVDLAALARDKVRPGGRVVCETVNPQSLYVYAHSFYLDPTHSQPVHPAYLSFLFREAGFAEVAIDWRSPPPANDVLEPAGGEGAGGEGAGGEGADGEGAGAEGAARDAADLTGTNVARLNRILFAPQDYAIVATR